mgnify:CR=1 FL=1
MAALWPETEAIAEAGLVGIACTSYKPMVAPAGAKKALFGTNPISFAWPRPGKTPVVYDMATASMAMGEVQVAKREGHKVPLGTGLTKDGKETIDPGEIADGGVLLPFGGYKGSAIAMMVELMAGALVGDNFSYETALKDNNDGGPPSGGEFILAICPDKTAGTNWQTHADEFFDKMKSMGEVRLPGERRHKNRLDKGPRNINEELVNKIKKHVGINVSVGLSYNKYLAKVCSDLDKPKGFSVIGREESKDFLSNKPVSLLWGIGKKFTNKLNSDGIINIGQIQKIEIKELVKRYGVIGLHIYQLSNGEDSRSIRSNRPIKSISHETTFTKNIKNRKKLENILSDLSRKVALRARKNGLGGKTINLKLKTKNFKSISRSKTINNPTQLERKIYKVAKDLLTNIKNNEEYRLIGVGISELVDENLSLIHI